MFLCSGGHGSSAASGSTRYGIAGHNTVHCESATAVEQSGILARSASTPAQQQQTSSPSQVVEQALNRKRSDWESKRGNLAVPPLANLLCRLGSAQNARMFLERRAPQKRCDQRCCSSKPGGVMIPPELLELTTCLYSSDRSNASEDLVNLGISWTNCFGVCETSHLMNSVSRNWSRPTKDFTVR